MRSSAEVCADCGASDPSWASMNRGVKICHECCGVHRSLGRHISHIKSLKKSHWSASLLQMLNSLSSSGANSIWEYALIDPASPRVQSRRKPAPKDPVHPTKSEFIRAKYQNQSFIHRSSEDDESNLDELNKQLHAIVRTDSVETTLRFLVQGADPNFAHLGKGGSTPMHVAARANQLGQVELLCVYGADPGATDQQGRTPRDCALEEGHQTCADRLLQLQYELTDRLTEFLCGRRPEHERGKHWLVPQMADGESSPPAAQQMLVTLPHRGLEELSRDLYDEVDRRETENIWCGEQGAGERNAVPFLPVNPEFSSTRNQGRQKLARLTARELATLLIDTLTELRRRHEGSAKQLEEPLYDSVASEDAELEETKRQLVEAKNVADELRVANRALQQEVSVLQSMVSQLMAENTSLRGEPARKTMSVCETRMRRQEHDDSDYDNEATRMPMPEEVVRRTDRITKRIQDLLKAAQQRQHRQFQPCADRVGEAVTELASVFVSQGQPMASLVQTLLSSAQRLQTECKDVAAVLADEEIDQLIERVIAACYDIARAAKQIVVQFPQ